MIDFHRTQMGDTFFNGTLPRLIKQLERLNENLERIAQALEAKTTRAQEEERSSTQDRE